MTDKTPNPRFDQYIELIKNDQVVGFTLENNDFQFLFDKNGGWYDQEGKYYNADAILCDPPEQSSSDQSEDQQKQKQDVTKLNEQLISVQLKHDQKVETIRNLIEIIQSYPQQGDEQIIISVSLQPPQTDQDKLVEEFIFKQLNQKVEVKNGEILNVFSEQLAKKIAELQGSSIKNSQKTATLYIDVELYDCVHISVGMTQEQLQKKLNEMDFIKNEDYANIQENKEQKRTYLQIRKDIEQQLKEEIDFQVQQ